jgi:hypothetical protein
MIDQCLAKSCILAMESSQRTNWICSSLHGVYILERQQRNHPNTKRKAVKKKEKREMCISDLKKLGNMLRKRQTERRPILSEYRGGKTGGGELCQEETMVGKDEERACRSSCYRVQWLCLLLEGYSGSPEVWVLALRREIPEHTNILTEIILQIEIDDAKDEGVTGGGAAKLFRWWGWGRDVGLRGTDHSLGSMSCETLGEERGVYVWQSLLHNELQEEVISCGGAVEDKWREVWNHRNSQKIMG